MPFASWLDGQGLTDAHLRWYLDYCCRDDYGEGLDQVSAWAGIHYFASRHGFAAPGDGDAPRDQVLTWPGGNGQLSAYLAQPLGGRLHTGQLITRIRPMRSGVEVLAFDVAQRQWSRWECESCVLALPVHVASRVLENSPDWVRIAASQIRHAAWVVANIHLDAPLLDRGPDLDGAAPAWDNVIHGGAGLGYVDARHQSTRPVPGPTVLTWYAALGSSAQAKQGLLQASWRDLASRALDDIGRAHADIRQRATRVNVMRYGHAMAAPNANTMRTVTDLHQRFADGVLRTGRIAMAHSDWSGYSVFEESYTRGYRVAQALIGVRTG
jgi:hypothetical protein